MNVQLPAHIAQLVFIHSVYIKTRMFFDSIKNRHAFKRSFKADDSFPNGYIGGAVQGNSHFFEQLLRDFHHPVIILIRRVPFQDSEFGVVRSVHSFIAEIAAEFVYPVETANDQPFQVQLIGNAQVKRHIERIVVCYKQGRAVVSARNGLQYRRVHFQRALLIEEIAHGVDHFCALQEGIASLWDSRSNQHSADGI